MLAAGIDVGSVAAKAVIFDSAAQAVVGSALLPTGWNTREAGEAVLDAACHRAGASRHDLEQVVATGYGRIALPFAQKTITEITCHAKGAAWLFPGSGVVLDIGGQDSKAISLDENGGVRDFVMNDKCAAGTGRFLQVLAGILGMPLDELGKAAANGKPVPISSMCAVFAETEIVGLLAQGTAPADLAAGVFVSIARRMRGLARRIAFTGQCVFTGGMATSPAFCNFLAQELDMPVQVPEQPQLVGALGAALLAVQRVEQKKVKNSPPKQGKTKEQS